MSKGKAYDAVVVGSGPNGLSAAITLARAGKKVLVREAAATVGGASRSAELTLPGFTHDVCSAVQALVPLSPFFQSLKLADHGLSFVEPAAAFAHPLDDGTAAIAYRSFKQTGATLGVDGATWERKLGGFVTHWEKLIPELLAPMGLTAHPLLMANFGLGAMRSAQSLARKWFSDEPARALFAGVAAHAILPFDWTASAAAGLVLTVAAHVGGWPMVRGGAQELSNVLARYFTSLGGVIETNAPVGNIDEFSDGGAILCDVSPQQLIAMAGHKLPERYRRSLQRYRYGPGVWKVDWALDGPIPWNAEACAQAGTVHLGGTFDEIAIAENAPWNGQHAEMPFVLLGQPSLFDSSRAPTGKHTAWAYCLVPNGSNVDMTDRIESQVERFAKGFRQRILAKHVMSPADFQAYNANLIGGDITGGANMLRQVFARPALRRDPYATPVKGLYLCSASTPPGGGVHGMCGYWAARSALRRDFV